MRRPHLRFSVRGMMIVVAIVAIALGAGQLWRRRAILLEQSRLERKREAVCEGTIRLISLVRRGQWPYEPSHTFGVRLPDGGSIMIRAGRISHSDDQVVWKDVDLDDVERLARWSASYQRAAGDYAASARMDDRAARSLWSHVELGPPPKKP